jgi:hypothetical protein
MLDPLAARQFSAGGSEPAVEVIVVWLIVSWGSEGAEHSLCERNVGFGQHVDQAVKSVTVGHVCQLSSHDFPASMPRRQCGREGRGRVKRRRRGFGRGLA